VLLLLVLLSFRQLVQTKSQFGPSGDISSPQELHFGQQPFFAKISSILFQQSTTILLLLEINKVKSAG
jgi:hypothetical protein